MKVSVSCSQRTPAVPQPISIFYLLVSKGAAAAAVMRWSYTRNCGTQPKMAEKVPRRHVRIDVHIPYNLTDSSLLSPALPSPPSPPPSAPSLKRGFVPRARGTSAFVAVSLLITSSAASAFKMLARLTGPILLLWLDRLRNMALSGVCLGTYLRVGRP